MVVAISERPSAVENLILAKRLITPEIAWFEVQATGIARHWQAGQFVILRPRADSERIPLTLVDGDPEKIVPLVRQAVELGADIIKADPTDDVSVYHRVVEIAGRIPVLCVVGDLDPTARGLAGPGVEIVSLTERFGEGRARAETVARIEEVVADFLSGR